MEAAQTDIWQLLRATSRTFYLSIRVLPPGMDESLALAYLLLRVSDYLEDSEAIPRERKIRLLRLWGQVTCGEASVRELDDTIRAHPEPDRNDYHAALAAGDILKRVHDLPAELGNTILRHVHASTLGMIRWVERGHGIETEADMDDYMHEVAGRVGYLSTEVFAYHSSLVKTRFDHLMALSRETGLALQTVNVIRGIPEDFARGWIFIPRSFLRKAGLSPGDLLDAAHRDDAIAVLELLVKKAERHLESALDYVLLIPRVLHRVRLACIWPMLFAARTVAISRGNSQVFTGEVKISRRVVRRIVMWSRILGWSNRWVVAYTRKLLHSG